MAKSVEKLPSWDLEKIYPDTASWEADFALIRPAAERFAAYRGRLGESAAVLREAIEALDAFSRLGSKVHVYAHLKADENTADNEARARQDKVELLFAELSGASAFFEPEIMAIDDGKMKQFLESPELAFYRRSLEELLREKPHVLSEKEERVIGLYSDVLGTAEKVFSILNDADMSFGSVTGEGGVRKTLTHGNYRSFLESSDRRVRRDAFRKMLGSYKKLSNTFSVTLDSEIKSHVVSASMRNYPSAFEAALSGGKIPVAVYTGLIDAVHRNLPALHRYFDLRRRVLKLDKLDMYDISTPLVDDCRREFSWKEAQKLVMDSLQVMGSEYSAVAEKAFSQRWMDVPERKGKRSGAYSSGCYDTYPYMLLNFNGMLDDVFTLTHELGHSVHSYFSRHAQHYHYASYSIMLAEVASTTNEMLLSDYLMKKNAADKKMRAYLLAHLIDEIRATLYRQTMFAEFELWMHSGSEKKTPLTRDLLCEKYAELNRLYHGSAVEPDGLIAYEWARIPHFYYGFYVYKYATGISSAIAFAGKILSGDKAAKERYLGFLKAGCSKDSLDILSDAGVDLVNGSAVDDALKYFGRLVAELEECLL